MLDFYIIKDKQQSPSSPKNLKFAGGLNDIMFNNLQVRDLINKKYDYYSDFRWSYKVIEEIYNKLLSFKDIETNSELKILLSLLNKAKETNSGLIAFCD